ncbi:metallophosphoesterase family protein [Ramlibacter sp. AW1]|uniref:Phosphoesterase n=1 Tax=Ramlibacter aurantiacus TaxID=2801330 RepID=A0A936ZFG6_9BURK|nr:metallophosphoesterase family protein [Ramlibacter aurantiacus]MBL0419952.1 metallophosphoesterase family protein [Ramlibacter aurantiacus]
MTHRIGLISDTHRLLRPEAVEFLRGCELILHAGDLVTPDALEALRELAPVVAVRGNNDHGEWAQALPERALAEVGPVRVLVLHDLADLRHEPVPAGVRVVVSGHSHKPLVQQRDGLLFVNPGSAGPRRFSLPVSVGELRIRDDGHVQAGIHTLA